MDFDWGREMSALTPQSLKRRLQSSEDLSTVSTGNVNERENENEIFPSSTLLRQGEYHQMMCERLNPSPPFPLQLLRPQALTDFFLKRCTLEHYFRSRESFQMQPLVRPFVRSTAPNISLHAYLERLFKYCQPEPVILLSIVAYTERLVSASNRFVPPNGLHRWIVAAWLVASKVMNGDQFWTNAFWARVAGISVTELMLLEVEFIRLFDWKLHVSVQDLSQSYNLLINSIE